MIIVVTNIRDMQTYVNDMNKSYGAKRTVYSEFQNEVTVRGYSYTKEQFTKEKYPKFPKRLRESLIKMI
jgi:hypothetical protein